MTSQAWSMADTGRPAATGHRWFGTRRLTSAAPAPVIREMLRTELKDTGWPYQPLLPSAPIVLPRDSYAELFRAGAALLALVRRTALESAATTDGRLAAYDMPESEHQLFVADQVTEERYADCVSRPDVVIGTDGPKFLEFNVSAGLGGPVETHCRLAVWRRLYADSSGRAPFSSQDPFGARAEMFRDLCDELGAPPRVAVVGSVRELGVESARYFEMESDYYDRIGLSLRFFEPEDLHEAWDCAPNLRYGIGLRNFTLPDFARLGISTGPVRAALDHGCLLVNTQTTTFLSSKLTMGMLSEGRPWMSAAERTLVSRYLPWTRVMADRRTTWRGEDIDLAGFAADHREVLVLKTSLGMSGEEVMIGRLTGQAEWEAAVASSVTSGTSVVQEFVEPRTCTLGIIADGDDVPYDVDIAPVFGPLLFRGHAAGLFTRFFGDGSAGVVSVLGQGCGDNCAVAV